MGNCNICGQPQGADLFSFVTGEPVCSICKIKFVGGLPTTPENIAAARKKLGLCQGQFLVQNNPEEASKILGK